MTSPEPSTAALSLDIPEVKVATGKMYQAIENLRLAVKAVDSASDEVRRGWKGSAHSSFYDASVEWDTEASKLNARLDDLTATVEKATEAILDMDEDDFIPKGGYTSL
jgi:WXG100 family type VII secretion target